MRVDDKLIRELSDRLAKAIANELQSTHAAALLLHEPECLMLVKITDLIKGHNPIQGELLSNVRKGLDAIWDNSKVLSGRDMDFLARALDEAQEINNWKEESEKHWLANAY